MSTAPDDQFRLLVQLADELNQREAGYLVRAAGVNTRATILISAATIVGALQVTHAGGLWIDIAMGFAVLASALALFVIWPRDRPTNTVLEWRDALWDVDQFTALYALIEYRHNALQDKEDGLVRRGRALRLGFASFIGTVVCAALAVWFN